MPNACIRLLDLFLHDMQPLLRALSVRVGLRDRVHQVEGEGRLLRGELIPRRSRGASLAIEIRLLLGDMVALRGALAALRLDLLAAASCARIILLESVTGVLIASSHMPATPVEVPADEVDPCLRFLRNLVFAFATRVVPIQA